MDMRMNNPLSCDCDMFRILVNQYVFTYFVVKRFFFKKQKTKKKKTLLLSSTLQRQKGLRSAVKCSELNLDSKIHKFKLNFDVRIGFLTHENLYFDTSNIEIGQKLTQSLLQYQAKKVEFLKRDYGKVHRQIFLKLRISVVLISIFKSCVVLML